MSKWLFPLDLDVIGPTEDSMSFQNINLTTDIFSDVEIPIGSHVGAFGVQRKMHVHNGVDLYCEPSTEVLAVEDGIVVDIRQWTGEGAGSSWWNDTWAVLVEGESGAIAYSEIFLGYHSIGDKIKRGQHIGFVKTVLKKYKGRPTTMLHFQMYKHGHICAGGWDTNNPKPETLVDPTPFLLEAEQKNEWIKIRVGY
jgi:murein DD-endopeptidase MepM/ murein hydrolase activator NlpD